MTEEQSKEVERMLAMGAWVWMKNATRTNVWYRILELGKFTGIHTIHIGGIVEEGEWKTVDAMAVENVKYENIIFTSGPLTKKNI